MLSFTTCTPEKFSNEINSNCQTSDLGIDTIARYYIYSPPPSAGFTREWQWTEKGDTLILYGFDGLEDSYFDYLFFKKECHCIKFVKHIVGYADDNIVLDEDTGNVIYWGWYLTYFPQENEFSLQDYIEDELLIGNVKHEDTDIRLNFDFDFYFDFKQENHTPGEFLEFIYTH